MTEWVKCSDRLPDVCERVLVVEPHGYIAVAQYVPSAKSFYERNKEVTVKYWAELPESPKDVTYWQKLPEEE